MSTYDVKVWDPRKIGDTAKGRWRVRWAVAGREHCKSFAARPLADGFAAALKDAIRDRRPFDENTGLPATARPRRARRAPGMTTPAPTPSMKWPQLAPTSRRSVAEALTTITPALTRHQRGAPDPQLLSRALFGWAFNPGTRNLTPPADITAALDWIAAASLPVAALEDPAVVRAALGACAAPWPASPPPRPPSAASAPCSTTRSATRSSWACCPPTRSTRSSGRPPASPRPSTAASSPARPMARALLAGVRAQGARGEHLEAFYGCIYYAATRPSETVMLAEPDLTLPSRGWGRIDLAASAARAGRDWTDDGTARQARGLKHRAPRETRSVPIPPVLVTMLRAHLRTYGTAADGRLFRTSRGGLIQDSAYSAVWQAARTAALTPAQHASPLARRPYDLRHAAVSLWLNAGVPATEVARRAGHSVAVLLKVYAHCIDGQADTVNKRIAGRPRRRPTSKSLTGQARARNMLAPRRCSNSPSPAPCILSGAQNSSRPAYGEPHPQACNQP